MEPMSEEEIAALQKRVQDAEASAKLLQEEKTAALQKLKEYIENPNQKSPISKLTPGRSFDSIIKSIDFPSLLL